MNNTPSECHDIETSHRSVRTSSGCLVTKTGPPIIPVLSIQETNVTSVDERCWRFDNQNTQCVQCLINTWALPDHCIVLVVILEAFSRWLLFLVEMSRCRHFWSYEWDWQLELHLHCMPGHNIHAACCNATLPRCTATLPRCTGTAFSEKKKQVVDN